MIDLTVKTLDSQNHTFSLNDDITVRQFKEHIATTVNIAADLQRLIYCGRVLQDDKLLNEYDVNGKVIHLVQRAPPSSTQRNAGGGQSQGSGEGGDWPQTPRIHYHQTQFHGNPIYVGSVSIPADVLESYEWPVRQASITSATTHVGLIRRMLDQANRVIDRLDNPSSTSASTTAGSSSASAQSSTAESDESSTRWATPGGSSASSSEPAASSASSEDIPTTSQQPAAPETTDGAVVPRELSELLEKLLTTQERLRPYIQDRLLATPSTSGEATAAENQRVMNGVTECFHFLAHAQHALSNLNVNMHQPGPRTLYSRPAVIQPSTILQAGLPIQVEAHISLHGQNDGSPDAEDAGNGSNNANRPATAPTNASPPSATTPDLRPPVPEPRAPTHESGFGTVFNFPNNVEVVMQMGTQAPTRAWSTWLSDQTQSNNNNNNNNNTTTANNNNSGANPAPTSAPNATGGAAAAASAAAAIAAGAGAFPWGGAPSPDLIRNLMQAVAGYMAQTANTPASPVTTAPTAPTTRPCTRRRAVTIAVGSDSMAAPGQNSQTRGNTETHPTTSTQTRTTSRTHVIHQHTQALGVGMGLAHSLEFDPFLPCTSHYIRRQSAPPTTAPATTQPSQSNACTCTTPHDSQAASQANATTSAPRMATNAGVQMVDSFLNSVPLADSINNSQAFARHPHRMVTFHRLLTSRGIHLTTEGESRSLLQNLYNVLGRLSIDTWLRLLSGDRSPLTVSLMDNLRRELRTLYPSTSIANIPATVAQDFSREIAPQLQHTFQSEEVVLNGREVDIYSSVDRLLRTFVEAVAKAIFIEGDVNVENLNSIVNNLMAAIQVFMRELNALLRYTLHGGETGVERVILVFAAEMTRGTLPLFREWVFGTVVEWFCNYVQLIGPVPESFVDSMLVYKDDSEQVATTSSESPKSPPQPNAEPMEVDSASNDRPSVDPLLDDGEEVPTPFPGHENLIPESVPIIARDATRQRRQVLLGLADNNVATLSDAYLATMPNKRRKLVKQQKPSLLVSSSANVSAIPSSMERLVRESVGRAGFEEVDGAVSALVGDSSVRRAFGQAIRESLNPRRYQTPDFPDPLRFPNATKFFSDSNRPPPQQ